MKKEPSKEFGYIYIDDKNDGGFYYFEKEKDASLIYKKKGIESEITDRNYYIEGEGKEQIIFIGDEEAWNPKDDFSVISGRKLFNSKGLDENKYYSLAPYEKVRIIEQYLASIKED